MRCQTSGPWEISHDYSSDAMFFRFKATLRANVAPWIDPGPHGLKTAAQNRVLGFLFRTRGQVAARGRGGVPDSPLSGPMADWFMVECMMPSDCTLGGRGGIWLPGQQQNRERGGGQTLHEAKRRIVLYASDPE